MKIDELAEELKVSPRMIREYKKELESLRIDIKSDTGKYGGYYLGEWDNSILSAKINSQDFNVLKMAESYLKQEGFMYSDKYERVVDKVNSNLKNKRDELNIGSLVLQANPDIDEKEERSKYSSIQEGIVRSKKIRMSYFSLSSGLSERVIRPYGMYRYQGFWYVVAYCEKNDALRDFKLVRMEELEMLEDEFKRPDDFSMSNYFEGCIGLIKDENMFKVKLRIDYPTSAKVSERIWVKNQEISFNEDKSIIFEAEMTGMSDIVNWILGLGSDVQVLEPVELKKKVRSEAERIVNNYSEKAENCEGN
jgi:predicted DNA-binding transcriptional regulator YafY